MGNPKNDKYKTVEYLHGHGDKENHENGSRQDLRPGESYSDVDTPSFCRSVTSLTPMTPSLQIIGSSSRRTTPLSRSPLRNIFLDGPYEPSPINGITHNRERRRPKNRRAETPSSRPPRARNAAFSSFIMEESDLNATTMDDHISYREVYSPTGPTTSLEIQKELKVEPLAPPRKPTTEKKMPVHRFKFTKILIGVLLSIVLGFVVYEHRATIADRTFSYKSYLFPEQTNYPALPELSADLRNIKIVTNDLFVPGKRVVVENLATPSHSFEPVHPEKVSAEPQDVLFLPASSPQVFQLRQMQLAGVEISKHMIASTAQTLLDGKKQLVSHFLKLTSATIESLQRINDGVGSIRTHTIKVLKRGNKEETTCRYSSEGFPGSFTLRKLVLQQQSSPMQQPQQQQEQQQQQQQQPQLQSQSRQPVIFPAEVFPRQPAQPLRLVPASEPTLLVLTSHLVSVDMDLELTTKFTYPNCSSSDAPNPTKLVIFPICRPLQFATSESSDAQDTNNTIDEQERALNDDGIDNVDRASGITVTETDDELTLMYANIEPLTIHSHPLALPKPEERLQLSDKPSMVILEPRLVSVSLEDILIVQSPARDQPALRFQTISMDGSVDAVDEVEVVREEAATATTSNDVSQDDDISLVVKSVDASFLGVRQEVLSLLDLLEHNEAASGDDVDAEEQEQEQQKEDNEETEDRHSVYEDHLIDTREGYTLAPMLDIYTADTFVEEEWEEVTTETVSLVDIGKREEDVEVEVEIEMKEEEEKHEDKEAKEDQDTNDDNDNDDDYNDDNNDKEEEEDDDDDEEESILYNSESARERSDAAVSEIISHFEHPRAFLAMRRLAATTLPKQTSYFLQLQRTASNVHKTEITTNFQHQQLLLQGRDPATVYRPVVAPVAESFDDMLRGVFEMQDRPTYLALTQLHTSRQQALSAHPNEASNTDDYIGSDNNALMGGAARDKSRPRVILKRSMADRVLDFVGKMLTVYVHH